jgi:hypothetical protein
MELAMKMFILFFLLSLSLTVQAQMFPIVAPTPPPGGSSNVQYHALIESPQTGKHLKQYFDKSSLSDFSSSTLTKSSMWYCGNQVLEEQKDSETLIHKLKNFFLKDPGSNEDHALSSIISFSKKSDGSLAANYENFGDKWSRDIQKDQAGYVMESHQYSKYSDSNIHYETYRKLNMHPGEIIIESSAKTQVGIADKIAQSEVVPGAEVYNYEVCYTKEALKNIMSDLSIDDSVLDQIIQKREQYYDLLMEVVKENPGVWNLERSPVSSQLFAKAKLSEDQRQRYQQILDWYKSDEINNDGTLNITSH